MRARSSSSSSYINRVDLTVQLALCILIVLYFSIMIGTFWKMPDLITDQHPHIPRLGKGRFHQIKNMIAASMKRGNSAVNMTKASIQGAAKERLFQPPPPPPPKQQEQEQQQPIDIHNIKTLQTKFPIHVDDYEEMIHPAYSEQLSQDFFNTVPKEMRVPKFWNPPEYGGDIRQYLGNYGERLMTMEEATSVGSKYLGLETIYIAIASYRDPECVPTLDSLFGMASHPERIRVAVIDQRLDGDPHCLQPQEPCDVDPEQTLCKYKHLIDGMVVDARLGVGPVFARHLGYRFYRGEYFATQLDSHVRFTIGWDDDIVLQWHEANNEMAVLTTYLSDLINSIDPKTNKAIRPGRPIMCKTQYEGKGDLKHLRHGQQPEGPPGIHGTPTLHPFWAAGFSFARGHFVLQVPYDQYLPMVFQGEEISIGLRGFTYGYDFYTPERPVCFHMYALKENKAKRDKVPHFWENSRKYAGVGSRSMKRLNALIGLSNPNDDSDYEHAEEEKYGMGKIRVKEKFFRTYGIHPETQTVEDNLCMFVGKQMQNRFIPKALRSNGMGLDYDKIGFEFVDPMKKPSELTQEQKEQKKRNQAGA